MLTDRTPGTYHSRPSLLLPLILHDSLSEYVSYFTSFLHQHKADRFIVILLATGSDSDPRPYESIVPYFPKITSPCFLLELPHFVTVPRWK